MRHSLLLLIIIAFGLQSCNVGTFETWKDDNIEPSLKSEIQVLDEIILEAITSNNPDLIKSIMSDEILDKDGEEIEALLKQVSNTITTTKYEVLNQYHVKNSTTGVGNSIRSGLSDLNGYTIQYRALNEEMFVSIIIPNTEFDEVLITSIYGKYSDGWKLNILQLGLHKIDGQTAPELFSEAKDKFDKGYLVDAANIMFLCSQVANPANKHWQYHNEEEMKVLQEKITASVNSEYSFPITLEKIDSKPQIFNIFPQRLQEGHFPTIEYLTKLDLSDTVKLKIENDRIHDISGDIFSGIDKDKKFVLYKAFNQIPDGKTPVTSYGFVKEVD